MLLHDVLRSAQADAFARKFADHVCPTVVPIEDWVRIRRGYPDAAVNDHHRCPIAITPPLWVDPHDDGSSLRAVLDRVGEEIPKHALQTRGIPLAHQLRQR